MMGDNKEMLRIIQIFSRIFNLFYESCFLFLYLTYFFGFLHIVIHFWDFVRR